MLEQRASRRRFAERVDADDARLPDPRTCARNRSRRLRSRPAARRAAARVRGTPRPGCRTRSCRASTRRAPRSPSRASGSTASIASSTSEPVAIRMILRATISAFQSAARSRRLPIAAICASARSENGRFWRLKIRHDGPCDARPPGSRPPPIRPCRTDAIRRRCGIRRRLATCSIDWWVGPSSPRPIESCVNTKMDAQLHQRRHAQRVARSSPRTSGRYRRTE